jgi:hypothetical protein
MFRLSKWYLDCVADNGDAAVLYWASLRWGLLRLHYGATLLGLRDGDPTHRYTLRRGPPPTWVGNDELCVCPCADATVRIGDRTVTGLGYAEHLTMTVKPWQLPFNELQWGRFLCTTDVLIWIAWRGTSPATWVFLNGEERRSAEITATAVTVPQDAVALRLDAGQVLRAGRLATTALRSLRAVALLVPRWRVAHEEKRISRATLAGGSGSPTGWAVHEVVRWP